MGSAPQTVFFRGGGGGLKGAGRGASSFGPGLRVFSRSGCRRRAPDPLSEILASRQPRVPSIKIIGRRCCKNCDKGRQAPEARDYRIGSSTGCTNFRTGNVACNALGETHTSTHRDTHAPTHPHTDYPLTSSTPCTLESQAAMSSSFAARSVTRLRYIYTSLNRLLQSATVICILRACFAHA